MGTKVDDIVIINITRATARLTRVGFGEYLFLDEVSIFSDRTQRYNEPADLLDAGFIATDPAYLSALIAFSQSQSPTSFKIGRKLANVNAQQKISFDATPDAGSFKIVFGAETTGAIAYNAVAADVKTALELLTGINEVTVTGSITSATGLTIEFTGADGNASKSTFTISTNILTIASVAVTATVSVLAYGSAVESYTTALNAILAFDADWYILTSQTVTKSEILELAAIMETQTKMYAYRSADADILTSVTTDIASALKALNYDRTFGYYCSVATKYPEMAIVGLQLPKNPGKSNWAIQTIAGVAAEALNSVEASNATAKRINVIENIGGAIVTSPVIGAGSVASGEFIDIIRGTDWIEVRMAERVFGTLVNEEKVPFTNDGGATLEGDVRAQLDQASSEDFPIVVKSTIVVSTPDVSAVAPADKSARIFGNITFSADYQGAVNKVRINGTLSF